MYGNLKVHSMQNSKFIIFMLLRFKPYFSTRLLFMKSVRDLGSVMKLSVLNNATI